MSKNPLIKKPWSKRSDQLIADALLCLEARFYKKPEKNDLKGTIKDYMRLQLAQEKNEVFAILFFDELFHGTIHHVQVHSRAILQKTVDYNASQVFLAHNYPSGTCIPSQADQE